MNDFEAIKERTDIKQFIPSLVPGEPKKTGSTLGINPCPMCKHKDCFKIFPTGYKCFSCGSAGNMFNFIQDYFNIASWFDVLRKAAELTGHELKNSEDIKAKSPQLLGHQRIFNKAKDYYRDLLLADKKARSILSNTRNYTTKTIEEFHIGYTGDSWDGLYKFLAGVPEKEMLKSGLIKTHTNGKGGFRDAFGPGLFVFPHFVGKHVKDFSCKDTFKDAKIKAKKDVYNPRLMSEFRIGKDVHFYNQDALYYEQLIIVEGQHDAIQLMRALNKKNVLAITGNPSKDAMGWLLKKIKDKHILLAFDMDKPKKSGDLSPGDKYRRQFFLAMDGLAGRVQVMLWDNKKGKDIDEYLRGKK